jgi:hypothetical protein
LGRLCRPVEKFGLMAHGAAYVGKFQSADSVTYLRKSRQWLTAVGQFRVGGIWGWGVRCDTAMP